MRVAWFSVAIVLLSFMLRSPSTPPAAVSPSTGRDVSLTHPSIPRLQDTIRAHSSRTPAWGDAFLQQVAAVAASPSAAAVQVNAITHVATFTSGGFALYTRDDNAIHVMTADAKEQRVIRDQRARGTFRDVAMCLDELSDSLLVVCRPGREELSVLRLDGTEVSVATISSHGFYDRGMWIDNDGRYYESIAVPGAPAEGPEGKRQYVRRSLDGKIIDTLRVETPGPRFSPSAGVFLPDAFASVDPLGGVVWGNSSQYRIARGGPGRAPMVLTHEWLPVPITGDERRALASDAEARRIRTGRSERAIVPSTKPAVYSITVARDGRLWVSTFGRAQRVQSRAPSSSAANPVVQWRQPTLVDLFDRHGAYLAHFELPVGAELIAANGDRLWVVYRNALDATLPRMGVYVLRRSH